MKNYITGMTKKFDGVKFNRTYSFKDNYKTDKIGESAILYVVIERSLVPDIETYKYAIQNGSYDYNINVVLSDEDHPNRNIIGSIQRCPFDDRKWNGYFRVDRCADHLVFENKSCYYDIDSHEDYIQKKIKGYEVTRSILYDTYCEFGFDQGRENDDAKYCAQGAIDHVVKYWSQFN